MTEANEMHGTDFDWFAVDRNENVGIFATAGSGKIPATVLSSITAHDLISQTIDTPNWGNEAVWDDYANVGLYVFDWNGTSYVKVRCPQLNTKFITNEVSVLPKLSINFEEAQRISDDDLRRNT